MYSSYHTAHLEITSVSQRLFMNFISVACFVTGPNFSHHNHLVSLLVMVSYPVAVVVVGPLSRSAVPGSSGVVGPRGRGSPGHVHCVGVVIRWKQTRERATKVTKSARNITAGYSKAP